MKFYRPKHWATALTLTCSLVVLAAVTAPSTVLAANETVQTGTSVTDGADPASFQKTTLVDGTTTSSVNVTKNANGSVVTATTTVIPTKNADGSTTYATNTTNSTVLNGKTTTTTSSDIKTVYANGKSVEILTMKNAAGQTSVLKRTYQLNADGSTSFTGTLTNPDGTVYTTTGNLNPKTGVTTVSYKNAAGQTQTVTNTTTKVGNVSTTVTSGVNFNGSPVPKATTTIGAPVAVPIVHPPLNASEARYLLTRAGFAPSNAEMTALMALPSREAAVDSIIDRADTFAYVNPQPAWTNLDWKSFNTWLNPNAASAKTSADIAAQGQVTLLAGQTARSDLRNWWAVQLAQTKSPLAERMVLFWHNWFPVQDVNEWAFHQTDIRVRASAMGSYANMMHSMLGDPGLIQYLNQDKSTAAYPVANLARELMELFSIGIGNYTEQDVLEVARALTGITIDPATFQVIFNPKIHDNGSKTILGQTGNWGPDDVVNILLQQKSLAPRVVSKLWMEFVSPTPDTAAVNQIAATFKEDWQIRPVLRQLFLSDAFWNAANHGTLVKSPAEYVIGAVRGDLGMITSDPKQGADIVSAIWSDGEPFWLTPNVRGFLTGTNWINTSTLLNRQATAITLTSIWRDEVLSKQYSSLPVLTPAQYQFWATTVMGDQPILVPPTQNTGIVLAARQILSDPAYWLK